MRRSGGALPSHLHMVRAWDFGSLQCITSFPFLSLLLCAHVDAQVLLPVTCATAPDQPSSCALPSRRSPDRSCSPFDSSTSLSCPFRFSSLPRHPQIWTQKRRKRIQVFNTSFSRKNGNGIAKMDPSRRPVSRSGSKTSKPIRIQLLDTLQGAIRAQVSFFLVSGLFLPLGNACRRVERCGNLDLRCSFSDPEGRSIKWYSCGPTVYDLAHLGHARNCKTCA